MFIHSINSTKIIIKFTSVYITTCKRFDSASDAKNNTKTSIKDSQGPKINLLTCQNALVGTLLSEKNLTLSFHFHPGKCSEEHHGNWLSFDVSRALTISDGCCRRCTRTEDFVYKKSFDTKITMIYSKNNQNKS